LNLPSAGFATADSAPKNAVMPASVSAFLPSDCCARFAALRQVLAIIAEHLLAMQRLNFMVRKKEETL
jgi:hypothetical protein